MIASARFLAVSNAMSSIFDFEPLVNLVLCVGAVGRP